MVRIKQFILGFFLVVCAGSVYAQEISDLVKNIQTALLVPLLNIVVSVAYLSGAGFVVAAIFKFKAHKDNPTQITVGTPVMLLFVGIGLLFFPTLVENVMNSIGFSASGAGSLTFSGNTITG